MLKPLPFRQSPWLALGLLFALIGAGLLLPLLNAYTQPRNQVIQQGRYLFPAMAPIALLLTRLWDCWHGYLPPALPALRRMTSPA